MSESKTAALYARVSTTDQTCAVQLDALRHFAARRFTHFREYVDLGISGAQRHRPQVRAGIAHARRLGKRIVRIDEHAGSTGSEGKSGIHTD